MIYLTHERGLTPPRLAGQDQPSVSLNIACFLLVDKKHPSQARVLRGFTLLKLKAQHQGQAIADFLAFLLPKTNMLLTAAL